MTPTSVDIIKDWLTEQQIPFHISNECFSDTGVRVWHVCTTITGNLYFAELEEDGNKQQRNRVLRDLSLADPDVFTKLKECFDAVKC